MQNNNAGQIEDIQSRLLDAHDLCRQVFGICVRGYGVQSTYLSNQPRSLPAEGHPSARQDHDQVALGACRYRESVPPASINRACELQESRACSALTGGRPGSRPGCRPGSLQQACNAPARDLPETYQRPTRGLVSRQEICQRPWRRYCLLVPNRKQPSGWPWSEASSQKSFIGD
jgi:hypothetical protein